MGRVEGRVAICCERGLGQVLPAPLTTASYPSEFSETQLPRLPSLLAASQHRVGPRNTSAPCLLCPVGTRGSSVCHCWKEDGQREEEGASARLALGSFLALLGQGSAAGGQTEGRLVLHCQVSGGPLPWGRRERAKDPGSDITLRGGQRLYGDRPQGAGRGRARPSGSVPMETLKEMLAR